MKSDKPKQYKFYLSPSVSETLDKVIADGRIRISRSAMIEYLINRENERVEKSNKKREEAQ